MTGDLAPALTGYPPEGRQCRGLPSPTKTSGEEVKSVVRRDPSSSSATRCIEDCCLALRIRSFRAVLSAAGRRRRDGRRRNGRLCALRPPLMPNVNASAAGGARVSLVPPACSGAMPIAGVGSVVGAVPVARSGSGARVGPAPPTVGAAANTLVTLALLTHTSGLFAVLFGGASEAVHALIVDVMLMAMSNILIFSIWYWVIDPPGIGRRRAPTSLGTFSFLNARTPFRTDARRLRGPRLRLRAGRHHQ